MMQSAVVQWHNEALGNVDDFLRDNDKFVWHIARKFRTNGYKAGIDIEELHHIAQFGMLKAYQTFDKDTGIKWQTYGARVMTNEILMALRRTKKTSLDVSMESALSIDEQGNTLAIADTLHGASDVDISASWFWEYASSLSERDRLIIQLRFDGLKEYEISERLGISQSFISRILKRIQRDYERGEWKVGRTIGGDLETAKELILTTNFDNLTISNKTGVAVNRVRLLRGEVAVSTQSPVTVETSELVTSETIPDVTVIDNKEQPLSVLERLDTLRNKFSECIAELTEIEKEVRPLLEAKSEMSEVAKRLLELVG